MFGRTRSAWVWSVRGPLARTPMAGSGRGGAGLAQSAPWKALGFNSKDQGPRFVLFGAI